VGEQKMDAARITIIDYDEIHLLEKEVKQVEECFAFKETPTITWLNIDGLHEVEVIEKIGNHFGIHSLVLEDIVHTSQRPKIEDFEDYIFIVLKMLEYDEATDEIMDEQFSLILGKNFVITFQENIGDVFDPLRERIRFNNVRLRKSKTDYLAYAMIDAVVDNYFIILEKLGERIEYLEDELLSKPTINTLSQIHHLKRKLITLRKSVWPLREVINSLERGDSNLISEAINIFMRDVYDHTIQVIETLETYRDMMAGMLDTYLSSVSNKMNEVMKVLTIIATIFIPLTFFAGIYGMNFDYMPELKWRWGYFAVWGLMVLIGLGMIFYFRRKKWF
jgi:magnesium transporter